MISPLKQSVRIFINIQRIHTSSNRDDYSDLSVLQAVTIENTPLLPKHPKQFCENSKAVSITSMHTPASMIRRLVRKKFRTGAKYFGSRSIR